MGGGASAESKLETALDNISPDWHIFGDDRIVSSAAHINEILSEAGEGRNTYYQLSGSVTDGSIVCACRKKTININFTRIVNKFPLSSPTLCVAQKGSNCVYLESPPESQAHSMFPQFLDESAEVKEGVTSIVSPDKITARYGKLKTWNQLPQFEMLQADWYDVLGDVLRIEITPAICCQDDKLWTQFENRERKGWPQTDLVKNIKEKGFLLVPKDNTNSKQSRTWQVSFSLAETCLFQSLPARVRLAYIVFKLIADNIEIMRPDLLTSFHLKNVFFWAMEKDFYMYLTPHVEDTDEQILEENHFVQESNLFPVGTAVQNMLKRLEECLVSGAFPLYFDESVSLTPTTERSVIQDIVRKIKDFLRKLNLNPVTPFPFIDSSLLGESITKLNSKAGLTTTTFIAYTMQLFIYMYTKKHDWCINEDNVAIAEAFLVEMHFLIKAARRQNDLEEQRRALEESLEKSKHSKRRQLLAVSERFVKCCRVCCCCCLFCCSCCCIQCCGTKMECKMPKPCDCCISALKSLVPMPLEMQARMDERDYQEKREIRTCAEEEKKATQELSAVLEAVLAGKIVSENGATLWQKLFGDEVHIPHASLQEDDPTIVQNNKKSDLASKPEDDLNLGFVNKTTFKALFTLMVHAVATFKSLTH